MDSTVIVGVAAIAVVLFAVFIVAHVRKSNEFLRRRKAYVNNLKLGKNAGPEFREFFTIVEEKSHSAANGLEIVEIHAVTRLKIHDFHIKLVNGTVKELRKNLRVYL